METEFGTYEVKIEKYSSDDDFNGLTCEKWSQGDNLHRIGKPALIVRDEEGNEVLNEYYCRGQLHREDGAARISTNVLRIEEWYIDGLLHRENAPAHISTELSTSIISDEKWYQHGELHRAGGEPAVLSRWPGSGVLVFEQWWENGKPHRIGNPAMITRDDHTGEIEEARWFENGVKTSPNKNTPPVRDHFEP